MLGACRTLRIPRCKAASLPSTSTADVASPENSIKNPSLISDTRTLDNHKSKFMARDVNFRNANENSCMNRYVSPRDIHENSNLTDYKDPLNILEYCPGDESLQTGHLLNVVSLETKDLNMNGNLDILNIHENTCMHREVSSLNIKASCSATGYASILHIDENNFNVYMSLYKNLSNAVHAIRPTRQQMSMKQSKHLKK